MKTGLAFFLAHSFSKGKLGDAVFMAIGVAAAVFTTASAANAAMAFHAESQRQLSSPEYLEIQAAPAALLRSNDEAIERLDADYSRAFAMPADIAAQALLEVPSVVTSFTIQRVNFTVGDSLGVPDFGFPGGGAAAGMSGAAAGMGGQDFRAAMTGGGMRTQPAEDDTEAAGPAMPPADFVMPPDNQELRAAMQAAAEQEILEPALPERLSGARVDQEFFSAYRLRASEGDLFTAVDIGQANFVLVAGANIAKELFADGQALGRRIRLNGLTYTIIGVLEETRSSSDFRSINDMVFVPASQISLNLGGGMRNISMGQLTFIAKDAASVGPALAELKQFFDRELGLNSIRLVSRKRELDERSSVQNTLFAAAFWLSGFCVLVASLNLINSAATHAVKRRKSLGMLRAIGATRRNAVLTALFENALPSLGGMLVGLALALAFSRQSLALLVPFANGQGPAWVVSALAALGAAAIPLLLACIPAVLFSRTAPASLVRPE